MVIRPVYDKEKAAYNSVVTHPMQSWEWGDFRKQTGTVVERLGEFDGTKLVNGFQVTFHDLPKVDWKIGYVPKSVVPDEESLTALKQLGERNKAIFIKFEPNDGQLVSESNQPHPSEAFFKSHGAVNGRPMFAQYTFKVDLKKSENQLLEQMKSKTRYNVQLAQKHGVEVVEDNSDEAFEAYLDLTFNHTTKRQNFFAHTKDYHRKMWSNMKAANIAHLLTAKHQDKILVTWILFAFNDVLYYPYGASSSQNREVMASNLMMWEAILFGKKLGCHTFDLWGSLGPKADPKDPWFGFHRFKSGYTDQLYRYAGTFDLVLNQRWYKWYKTAEKWRWRYLRLRAKIGI